MATPRRRPAATTWAVWFRLNYHRARLLIALGRSEEARALLDRVLPQLQASGQDSSVNAFRGLRMRSAIDLNEFLAFAPQRILLKQSESQASLEECVEVMRNPKRQYDCKKEVNSTQF